MSKDGSEVVAGFSAIHRKEVRPKVKYAVIYRHRNEYPVSVMCKFFEVSRSGYYDFVKRMGKPERDTELAEKIKECQNKTDKTYGYRRIWRWLRDRNIQRNPKTVLRIMKQLAIVCDYLDYTDISTYSFRKWYATEIYKANDFDIALVQRLLQHSSAATTQRYIGIEPQRIEQAIQNHTQLI